MIDFNLFMYCTAGRRAELERGMAGKDPQLEKAIEEGLRLLKGNEFKLKKEPKAPIRSRRPKGYQKEN